jgi:hypothetical protein
MVVVTVTDSRLVTVNEQLKPDSEVLDTVWDVILVDST